jgi:hypothetical protein
MLASTKIMKKALAIGMIDVARAEKMLLTAGNFPKIRSTRQQRKSRRRLRGRPIGASPSRERLTTKRSKIDQGFLKKSHIQ